jgi:hypothetical protein
MIRISLVCMLTAAPGMALATSGERSTSDRECDRLIQVLQGHSSAEAYAALEKMRVFRQGNQYRACIAAARVGAAQGPDEIRVTQLLGLDLYNDGAVQIGDVQQVAKDKVGRAYVITTYRGPRWPGNKQVALPLDRMTLEAGRLVIAGIGEEELHRMPAADLESGKFEKLGDQERVVVARSRDEAQATGSTAPRW